MIDKVALWRISAFVIPKDGNNIGCMTLSEKGNMHCESEQEALSHICKKFGFRVEEFESAITVLDDDTQKGRYIMMRNEDAEGNECKKGKYEAQYDIYIAMYQKI